MRSPLTPGSILATPARKTPTPKHPALGVFSFVRKFTRQGLCMGLLDLRKLNLQEAMISPYLLADPFAATWFHGTKMRFTNWKCPPPQHSPADVAHSALFFTTNRTFAECAGQHICCVQLAPATKVITPAQGGDQSAMLRRKLRKSNPLASHCAWLEDDSAWTSAWATGEIMRFAYDKRSAQASQAVGTAVAAIAINLKKIIATPLPEHLIMTQANQCLTRAWIEQIVREAAAMGYQAIHGAEMDRCPTSEAGYVAQPWLAVMDQAVIAAPKWI